MGNKLNCRVCRRIRYWDKRKFFNDERLCYECAVIMDFNVQHLIPVLERKTTNFYPRRTYKKIPNLQWYTLQKGNSEIYEELRQDAL